MDLGVADRRGAAGCTEVIGLAVRLCLRFGFLARVVTPIGLFQVGLVGILGSW